MNKAAEYIGSYILKILELSPPGAFAEVTMVGGQPVVRVSVLSERQRYTVARVVDGFLIDSVAFRVSKMAETDAAWSAGKLMVEMAKHV